MAPFAERIANLGFHHVWDGLTQARAWSERLLARPTVQDSRPPQQWRLPTPDQNIIAELRNRLASHD